MEETTIAENEEPEQLLNNENNEKTEEQEFDVLNSEKTYLNETAISNKTDSNATVIDKPINITKYVCTQETEHGPVEVYLLFLFNNKIIKANIFQLFY